VAAELILVTAIQDDVIGLIVLVHQRAGILPGDIGHGGGQFAHCREAFGPLQPFLVGLSFLEILQHYDVTELAVIAGAAAIARFGRRGRGPLSSSRHHGYGSLSVAGFDRDIHEPIERSISKLV